MPVQNFFRAVRRVWSCAQRLHQRQPSTVFCGSSAVNGTVHGYTIEPRSEPGTSAERAKRTEYLHENLLRDIPRLIRLAHDAINNVVNVILVLYEKSVERGSVARQKARDKIAVCIRSGAPLPLHGRSPSQ